MKLSEQQQEVIESSGDLVVNAVAGSGKTSTLVAYASKRKDKKILYLAFNKSVKNEAIAKFQQAGISNVTVETAHSLALKHFGFNKFTIRKSGYTAYDARTILKFKHKDIITDMKFGRHVIGLSNCFCNSSKLKVSELDYLSYLSGEKEREFVQKHYEALTYQTRRFLKKMKDGEIEIEHDYYLKEFQLRQPAYDRYDIIFFDEGQDASPVMLDVFLHQRAAKVIVGDEHQQIYGWRYAVNALREVHFPRKYLSTSYRFDASIASLAQAILQTKALMEDCKAPEIKGAGGHAPVQNHAMLGRTNSAVLISAIDQLIENKTIKSVYFEGNFNSYTYADEGGSVYDVLNLYLDKRKLIRDPLVKSFREFHALEEYAEESGDAPMKGIIEIVKKYQRDLPKLIKEIKDHHVDDDRKAEAEMIFSTVHKAKGMEYDEVTLLNDFLGEEKLRKLLDRSDLELDYQKLQEDINVLYVGVTRSKKKLIIPEELVPSSFDASGAKNIHIVESEDEELPIPKTGQYRIADTDLAPGKKYSYDSVRTKHKEAYKKWTTAEDDQLEDMFCRKTPISEIADHFGRTKGAITSRIKKLELREKYFDPG